MSEKQNNPFNKLLINKSEIVDLVLISIQAEQELLLTYFNQHCFNVWYENSSFRNILDNKFVSYLDGFGICVTLKLLKKIKINRFNASEINDTLFSEFAHKEIPLILIGGKFSKTLLNDNNLNIKLYINGYDGFRDLENLFNTISKSMLKIIIIGMGVPLQEELAYKISQKISGLQIICVGNFLEFYFGTKKRAPFFLRNSGFEWLFRLFTEPKRLWKRYIFGIPLFFYRILRIYFHKNQTYEDVS